MSRPWLNERDWQIYRFEFNPPRITTSDSFMVGGRKLIRFEEFNNTSTFLVSTMGVRGTREGLLFENTGDYKSNAEFIDGHLYTTKFVADWILNGRKGRASSHEVDRFKNIVAGVLSLSQAMCLDLVVRVVGFL